MPQASDEQRETMRRWFGDPISDTGPIAFLVSHGYISTRGFKWLPPVPSHSVSCYELECIVFLVCEWDYGFLIGGGPTVCLCGQRNMS